MRMISFSSRVGFVQIKASQSLWFALFLTNTIFAGIGFWGSCIQEMKHNLWSFCLCQLSTFTGNRSLVKVFCWTYDIWFFGRCDKTAVNRHKCIAIALSKCQQTESLAKLHSNMLKDSGTKFRLFTARAMKERIIDDEHVDTLFISQMFDVIIDDLWCQRRSKAKPIRFWRIQEAIESILWELFFERAGSLLHIHAFSNKHIAEFIFQKRNSRYTFFFCAVTLFLKGSYFVRRKKSLNTI